MIRKISILVTAAAVFAGGWHWTNTAQAGYPCPWNLGCSWQVCDYPTQIPGRAAYPWRTVTVQLRYLKTYAGYNDGTTVYPLDPSVRWKATCAEVGITPDMTLEEGLAQAAAGGYPVAR